MKTLKIRWLAAPLRRFVAQDGGKVPFRSIGGLKTSASSVPRRGILAAFLLPLVGGCRCTAVVVDTPPQEYSDKEKKFAQQGWKIKKCIGIERCWLHRDLPTYQTSENFPNG